MKCTGMWHPCDRMDAYKRRQNTAYVNDESNWVVMYDDCFEENCKYWDEMWKEYYSDCL